MKVAIELNIPDESAQVVFNALQETLPMEENEPYNDYISRVAQEILQNMTSEALIREAQKNAMAAIVFPTITVQSIPQGDQQP